MATLIDLATKMASGWQLAGQMRTSLVTYALPMAITHVTFSPTRSSTRQGIAIHLGPLVTADLTVIMRTVSDAAADRW